MKNWSDFKNSLNVQEYIKFWQKNGLKNFYIKDFPWIKYQGILQPTILSGLYEPPEFTKPQIKTLLKTSKSTFVRWSNYSRNRPTEWWWMTCRPPFSINLLSHNARNQTKKALINCLVKIISPQELIKVGYDCYLASCQTHKKTRPLNHAQWEKFIGSHLNYHCFDFWGIFIDDKLIGYSKCVKINKLIDISAIWYNRAYLKKYPIYALIYSMLNYYLNKNDYESVSNGMRSIAHPTKMQGFLETKFNFKKEYCKLNVIYSPFFNSLVKIIYPFKNLMSSTYKIIPFNILHKIIIILEQEKIRRSFN